MLLFLLFVHIGRGEVSARWFIDAESRAVKVESLIFVKNDESFFLFLVTLENGGKVFHSFLWDIGFPQNPHISPQKREIMAQKALFFESIRHFLNVLLRVFNNLWKSVVEKLVDLLFLIA